MTSLIFTRSVYLKQLGNRLPKGFQCKPTELFPVLTRVEENSQGLESQGYTAHKQGLLCLKYMDNLSIKNWIATSLETY